MIVNCCVLKCQKEAEVVVYNKCFESNYYRGIQKINNEEDVPITLSTNTLGY